MSRLYRIYGITLASDHHLQSCVPAGRGTADLHFSLSSSPLDPGLLGSCRTLYERAERSESGESYYAVFRHPEFDLIRFAEVGDFCVRTSTIHCHLSRTRCKRTMEVCLLGTVLSYWLETQARVALHAAAVAGPAGAVAFLASHHGGKTSLAVSLMSRGWSLLSDDILAIQGENGEVLGAPGYPQMRMWAEQAEHFLGRPCDLTEVYPGAGKVVVPVEREGLGSFSERDSPLLCIYLPERRLHNPSEEIRAEAVSEGEALIELIRHSFLPHSVEAAGFRERRLLELRRIVSAVPVKRLAYPDGWGHLPRVCEAIESDSRQLSVV